jgi:hypothetical protein
MPTISLQSVLAAGLVLVAAGLSVRSLWRTVGTLRTATRGAAACGDVCGCGDVSTDQSRADDWDQVAPATTRARTRG